MADKKVGKFAIRELEKLSFLVRDVEDAVKVWAETTGAGPFTLAKGLCTPVNYKGKDLTWTHDVALGQWGPVAIELIQTTDNSPAAHYQLEDGRDGKLYNMAYGVEDIEAECARIEALGYPCIWKAGSAENNDRVYMFDTNVLLGSMVQVYEASEAARAPYKGLIDAAKNWDGKFAVSYVYDCKTNSIVSGPALPGDYTHREPTHQICFLNGQDCKKTARQWAELFGAGPWLVSRNTPIQNLKYMGKPTDWLQDSALGQFGGLQVELMQTCDDSPAVHYTPGPIGKQHHINWFVDDIEVETKRLAALGNKVVWDCTCGDDHMPIKMFDADKNMGCLFEIYQRYPGIESTYDMISNAHRNWDGESAIMMVFDNNIGTPIQEAD